MIIITESQPLVYQPSEEHDLLVDRSLVELLLGEWLGGVTQLSFQLLTVPPSFVAAALGAAAFIAAAFIPATFVTAC